MLAQGRRPMSAPNHHRIISTATRPALSTLVPVSYSTHSFDPILMGRQNAICIYSNIYNAAVVMTILQYKPTSIVAMTAVTSPHQYISATITISSPQLPGRGEKMQQDWRMLL